MLFLASNGERPVVTPPGSGNIEPLSGVVIQGEGVAIVAPADTADEQHHDPHNGRQSGASIFHADCLRVWGGMDTVRSLWLALFR